MIKFTFSYKLKLLISVDLIIDTYTGAIGTKLRRNEFALRKEATKFMKDGCCSSLHVVLIIQTPLQPGSSQTNTGSNYAISKRHTIN